jgi:SnoaL-like domain
MNNSQSCFDRMLDAWNERDNTKIRAHLDAALAASVVFIDPTIETHGIDAFEANVQEFRKKYPTASLRRSSEIDSHHHIHRYSWEIAVESRVILVGFDVSETDKTGKVTRVLGFFGPLRPV